jgi:hypothetical protein
VTPATSPRVGSGYVNFTAGTHGSLLVPGTPGSPDAAVNAEMQRQAIGFIESVGTIAITDGTYIQP